MDKRVGRHVLSGPPSWQDLACLYFIVQSLPMKPEKVDIQTLNADVSAAWVSVFQSLGLPLYRVRVQDRMVCIEAPQEDFARLLAPEIRSVLIAHGKSLGYIFVTLDMGG